MSGRANHQGPTETPDPIDVLRRENTQLRRELGHAEAERDRLDRERTRLEREIARLKEELETARRAGARQAAPFSKGAPKRHPRRPGRQAGARYGRQGRRRTPTVINEIHDVPLPGACPTCGGAVEETAVAAQYQEDLPPVRPVIRRYDIHLGVLASVLRPAQQRDLDSTDLFTTLLRSPAPVVSPAL